MFQNTKTKRRISVFLTFIMFMTSFFGIEAAASDDSYTLAFTCNNKQTSRSIGINETMALSSIMSDLDLSGTVTNAVSSDSTSITAAQSGSDWLLSPQKGFGSAIITVTTEESDEYTIAVSCYKISMNFTYSLMFRPNGGKGTMDSLSGPAGTSFVMPECTFTPPDGQRFKEWHIQAPNSTFNPDYSGHIRINAGETYVIDDFDHFVFPIWEDKENVHTLTASYNTEQGGVSLPSREGAGENVTVYVQPAFGYAADTVTYSDGTESKTAQKQDDGTWTFTMPNADTSVSIGFKQESSPSVDYIDENGTSHTVTSYQNVMPEHIEWTGGWYVLPQNLTISDRITVSGNAKLILTDGNTLTAESGIGIENNASLTVYSQSNGENMGALVADTNRVSYNSAIGGTDQHQSANIGIVINGGKINATTSGSFGTAIGGSTYSHNSTSITIRGCADVTASGLSSGCGIGAGYSAYKNANITIGGNAVVYAKGTASTDAGAAIYAKNDDSTVTIADSAKVTAENSSGKGIYAKELNISGGTVDISCPSLEAICCPEGCMANITGGTLDLKGRVGIGASQDACGTIIIDGDADITAGTDWVSIGGRKTAGDIQIKGGTVNASVTGKNTYTPAIGMYGGDSSYGGGSITISGGTVTATAAYTGVNMNGAAIGSGWKGRVDSINITGGNVTAIGDTTYGTGIGIGNSGLEGDTEINISGGTVVAVGKVGIGISNGSSTTLKVNISGGDITASGASNSDKTSVGAAIGLGNNTKSTKPAVIDITGGKIKTEGTGNGIGAGTNAAAQPVINLGYTDTSRDDIEINAINYVGDVTFASDFMYNDTHAKTEVPVTDNKTIVAYDSSATVFYNVSVSDDIENGTVSADVDIAAEDDTVTLTVIPEEGYQLESISVNGETVTPTEGVYSFKMPKANVTVRAEFIKPGDVDLDGKVDNEDAALVLKYISYNKPFFAEEEAKNAKALKAANADGIGDVDMLDVIKILENSSGGRDDDAPDW